MDLTQVAAAMRSGGGEAEIVELSGEWLGMVSEARGIPPAIWAECLDVIADDATMKADTSWRLVDTITLFWEDMRPQQQAAWTDALAGLFRRQQSTMLRFTIAEIFGAHLAPSAVVERLVTEFHDENLETRAAIVHAVADAVRRVRDTESTHGMAIDFLRMASSDRAPEVREEAIKGLRDVR